MSEYTSCGDCIHYGASMCYRCVHGKLECFEAKKKKKKKKKKIIKLDEMVGSDIDMEFGNNKSLWLISKYENRTVKGYMSVLGPYRYCRIRQDHWHSWQGDKDCPLPEGLEIIAKQHGLSAIFETHTVDYQKLDWGSVYQFKVLGTTDNWIYKWQKEKEE